MLLDVRQRRGVRGSEYAWANSSGSRRPCPAGIGYRHHPELAPTTELRQLQYAEDDRQGVGKRAANAQQAMSAATPPKFSTARISCRSFGAADT